MKCEPIRPSQDQLEINLERQIANHGNRILAESDLHG